MPSPRLTKYKTYIILLEMGDKAQATGQTPIHMSTLRTCSNDCVNKHVRFQKVCVRVCLLVCVWVRARSVLKWKLVGSSEDTCIPTVDYE